MSDVINAAVAALTEKLGSGFDASVKFAITGEGAVMVDSNGVRPCTHNFIITQLTN